MTNYENQPSERPNFWEDEELIEQAQGDPERLHLLVRVANARYNLEHAAGKVDDDEYLMIQADLEYAKDELVNYDHPGEAPDIVE